MDIIITFIGSSIINNALILNKVKTGLALMITELESNKKDIETIKKRYELERDLGLFLGRHHKKISTANLDSVEQCQYIFFNIQEYRPGTEAFEMLKTSGLMQNIEDQNLTLSIITTYRNIQYAASNVAFYYDNKSKITEKLMDDKNWSQWYNDVDFNIIKPFDMVQYMISNDIFFRLTQLPTGCINSDYTFNPAIEYINKTIDKIKKNIRFTITRKSI